MLGIIPAYINNGSDRLRQGIYCNKNKFTFLDLIVLWFFYTLKYHANSTKSLTLIWLESLELYKAFFEMRVLWLRPSWNYNFTYSRTVQPPTIQTISQGNPTFSIGGRAENCYDQNSTSPAFKHSNILKP